MIRDIADRDVMGRYVTAVRREIATGAVDDDAAEAAHTIRRTAASNVGGRSSPTTETENGAVGTAGACRVQRRVVALLDRSVTRI